MTTPDPLTQVLAKGLAELRAVLEDATTRFESELQRVRETPCSTSTSTSSPPSIPTSAHEAVGQMERLASYLRSETTDTAGDVSSGIAGVMEEVSKFVYAAVPGMEEQVTSASSSLQRWMSRAAERSGEAAPPPNSVVADTPSVSATETAAKKTPAKKSAKKAAAKKSAKKAAAKKAAAKKSAKKAAAKKSAKKAAAKKSAKKAAAKKSAKKAAAKKSAKKTSAKKSAKKTSAKKSAKKTSAKKASAKKSAKKTSAKKR